MSIRESARERSSLTSDWRYIEKAKERIGLEKRSSHCGLGLGR